MAHPDCTLPSGALNSFQGQLKREVNRRLSRLKFKTERDATQATNEVTILYSRGKEDNRILKVIRVAEELDDKSVEEILISLIRIPNPKQGCS